MSAPQTRAYHASGAAVILSLSVVLVAWAATNEISGAIVAGGTVVVASSVKKIQHPSGGQASLVPVKNGDHVQKGDLLVKLDDTAPRATLRGVLRECDELSIRAARLKAERDSAPRIAVPPALSARAGAPPVVELIQAEIDRFESRRAIAAGHVGEMKKRISELKQEQAGLDVQLRAKEREAALVEEEIQILRRIRPGDDIHQFEIRQSELLDLTAGQRLMSLRREATRLEGEAGQIRASIAQVKGRIAEMELQILRSAAEAKERAEAELANVQERLATVEEKRTSIENLIEKLEIRAPIAGIVHELAITGASSVIAPGEVIMLLVPQTDSLVVDARIRPSDVDEILASNNATVRFPTLDRQATPELAGRVMRISADLARDQHTGAAFFVARIELLEGELARLGRHRLVPGMPADVLITTEPRSALSYLTKPLADQFSRAWREH